MTVEHSVNPFEAPELNDTRREYSFLRSSFSRTIEFAGFATAAIVSPIIGFVSLLSLVSVSPALFFFAVALGLATMSSSFVIVVRLFVRISERFRIDE